MNVSGRGYYFDAQFQAAPELPAAPDVEPTRNGHPAEELAPTVESRRWPLRTLAVATALMLLGGAALAGYFYYWSAQPSAGSLSINRLTATGRSHAAGISPDGKCMHSSSLNPTASIRSGPHKSTAVVACRFEVPKNFRSQASSSLAMAAEFISSSSKPTRPSWERSIASRQWGRRRKSAR